MLGPRPALHRRGKSNQRSDMTTSVTETYTTAAGQAREAGERFIETSRTSAKTYTDQANGVATLSAVDITGPVALYFDHLQKQVDLGREFAGKWAELVTSLLNTAREQAGRVGSIVHEQADTGADNVIKLAEKAEQVTQEQTRAAERAQEEQGNLVQAAAAETVERTTDDGRERYQDLTKAELVDILVERDLPKYGTVDELIKR